MFLNCYKLISAKCIFNLHSKISFIQWPHWIPNNDETKFHGFAEHNNTKRLHCNEEEIMVFSCLIFLTQECGTQKFWIVDPVFRGITQDI